MKTSTEWRLALEGNPIWERMRNEHAAMLRALRAIADPFFAPLAKPEAASTRLREIAEDILRALDTPDAPCPVSRGKENGK